MERGREGKICLIKYNMSRDNDAIGGKIEAPISLMIGRVS
jgi:hypothetical protein